MRKKYSNTSNDFFTWQLLALLALYAFGFHLVLDISNWSRSEQVAFDFFKLIKDFCVSYPNLVFISYLNFKFIQKLNERFPWERQQTVPVRLFLEITGGVLIVTALVVTVNVLIDLFFGHSILYKDYLYSVIIGGIINLILLLSMEFYFLYVRRYELALDNEWLKRENLSFQYDILKNQLNPHFLFNSLNTLSSLMSVDKVKGKKYVRKLSQVYRHILEHRDASLIALKAEVKFVEDYIYLLKIRFDDDLQVTIEVNEMHLQRKIVPMTLQILVENVVKHNAVLEGQPLRINIRSEQESIIIENNLQPKHSKSSWGIGLKTLEEVYKIHKKEIRIERSDASFLVFIPLI